MDGGNIGGRARVKRFVEAAVVAQASDTIEVGADDLIEESADEDLAVSLDDHGADRRVGANAGIEGSIEHAIGEQTSQAVTGDFIKFGKIASDHEAAINQPGGVLRSNGVNRAISFGVRAECNVQIAGRFAERFVVHNREDYSAWNREAKVYRAGQLQEDRFIAVALAVIKDGHVKGFADLDRKSVV